MHNNQPTLDSPKTKPILYNLYPSPQQLKATSTVKRSLISKPTHFLELAIFKQELKNYFPKMHTAQQYFSKVRYYRTIFFSLAILFLVLGGVIFFQNLSFTTFLFGELRLFVKNSLSAFSAFLAIFAAGLGYSLCVAKEAAESLACKARKKLAKIYTKKRIEFGIQKFFLYPNSTDKALLLKATYFEIHEKINERKTETADLLREIRKSQGFDTANHELLFSQALADMDEQIKQYLLHFKEFRV